jgi:hypothetical protein
MNLKTLQDEYRNLQEICLKKGLEIELEQTKHNIQKNELQAIEIKLNNFDLLENLISKMDMGEKIQRKRLDAALYQLKAEKMLLESQKLENQQALKALKDSRKIEASLLNLAPPQEPDQAVPPQTDEPEPEIEAQKKSLPEKNVAPPQEPDQAVPPQTDEPEPEIEAQKKSLPEKNVAPPQEPDQAVPPQTNEPEPEIDKIDEIDDDGYFLSLEHKEQIEGVLHLIEDHLSGDENNGLFQITLSESLLMDSEDLQNVVSQKGVLIHRGQLKADFAYTKSTKVLFIVLPDDQGNDDNGESDDEIMFHRLFKEYIENQEGALAVKTEEALEQASREILSRKYILDSEELMSPKTEVETRIAYNFDKKLIILRFQKADKYVVFWIELYKFRGEFGIYIDRKEYKTANGAERFINKQLQSCQLPDI